MKYQIIEASRSQKYKFLLQSAIIVGLFSSYYYYNKYEFQLFNKSLNHYIEKCSPKDFPNKDTLTEVLLKEIYRNHDDSNPINIVPSFGNLEFLLGNDENIVQPEKFRLFFEKGYLKALVTGITEDLKSSNNNSKKQESLQKENLLNNKTKKNDIFRHLKEEEKNNIYYIRLRLQVLSKYLSSNERKKYDHQLVEEYNILFSTLLDTITNIEWIYDRYNDFNELYQLDNEMKQILIIMTKDQSFHRCIAEKNVENLLLNYISRKNVQLGQRQEFRNDFYNNILNALSKSNNPEYEHLIEIYPNIISEITKLSNEIRNEEIKKNISHLNGEIFNQNLEKKRIYSTNNMDYLYVNAICFGISLVYMFGRLKSVGLPFGSTTLRTIGSASLLSAAFYQEYVLKSQWERNNTFLKTFHQTFVRMDTFSFLNTVICCWIGSSLSHYALLPLTLQLAMHEAVKISRKEQI